MPKNGKILAIPCTYIPYLVRKRPNFIKIGSHFEIENARDLIDMPHPIFCCYPYIYSPLQLLNCGLGDFLGKSGYLPKTNISCSKYIFPNG